MLDEQSKCCGTTCDKQAIADQLEMLQKENAKLRKHTNDNIKMLDLCVILLQESGYSPDAVIVRASNKIIDEYRIENKKEGVKNE